MPTHDSFAPTEISPVKVRHYTFVKNPSRTFRPNTGNGCKGLIKFRLLNLNIQLLPPWIMLKKLSNGIDEGHCTKTRPKQYLKLTGCKLQISNNCTELSSLNLMHMNSEMHSRGTVLRSRFCDAWDWANPSCRQRNGVWRRIPTYLTPMMTLKVGNARLWV